MRILFINTGPWGTGSFTVIKGLSKELLKLGHEVKIFFPDANFQSTDKDEYYKNPNLYKIWEFPINNINESIPTFPLMITDPHPRNPNPVTFKSLTDKQIELYEQELQKEIKKLIDEFKPDIIECHHIWYAGWVLHKMGLNYIVVAHHSDQLGLKYDPRIHRKALICAKDAKKIIAISESVKKEVLRLYHVDEQQVVTLFNGYDKDVFKKREVVRKHLLEQLKLDINPDATLISFAGKLSRTKGIDFLLRANKFLDPKLNIHFIIMGSGSLDEICDKMDPTEYSLFNMHFVGQQTPDLVSDIHNICRLSVMPSRSEGFGLSCLEAMGCGLPMVVSRCGGPEYFAVGKILERKDPQVIATAIQEMLRLTEEEYQQLSQRAMLVAQQYSWDSITQKHLEIYNSIIYKN